MILLPRRWMHPMLPSPMPMILLLLTMCRCPLMSQRQPQRKSLGVITESPDSYARVENRTIKEWDGSTITNIFFSLDIRKCHVCRSTLPEATPTRTTKRLKQQKGSAIPSTISLYIPSPRYRQVSPPVRCMPFHINQKQRSPASQL